MKTIKYKEKNAILIASETKRTTGIAVDIIRTLYVDNKIIRATYYSKSDASGSIFNLENVEVLADEATIPEFDKLLNK